MAYFLIFGAAFLRIVSHFAAQPPLDAISRFLPHLPNFAPIGALALFGGVYLNKKYALIIPIIAMIVADFFIGFYSPILMAFVYGSFIIIGLIGLYVKKHKNLQNVIGATLCGSVIFFLLTNFGMWAIQPYMPQAIYPQTLQGLVQSYTMGLPFFRNTLLGDLFYVGAMFGSVELAIYLKNKISIINNKKILA